MKDQKCITKVYNQIHCGGGLLEAEWVAPYALTPQVFKKYTWKTGQSVSPSFPEPMFQTRRLVAKNIKEKEETRIQYVSFFVHNTKAPKWEMM